MQAPPHGSSEHFLGIASKVRGILSTGHKCMMFPEPKNVIFVEILLRPNFSPRNSGLPYFYRVKLDVIGFGQKAHFWNRETSYIKVLYMISHELDGVVRKFFKMTRGPINDKNWIQLRFYCSSTRGPRSGRHPQ